MRREDVRVQGCLCDQRRGDGRMEVDGFCNLRLTENKKEEEGGDGEGVSGEDEEMDEEYFEAYEDEDGGEEWEDDGSY